MRCNVGINPIYLADQHLIAEYRELPMLIGSLEYWNWDIKTPIPVKFKLGNGHMNFLKKKLLYIKKRHNSVIQEMIKRNFKCDSLTIDLTNIDNSFCGDWIPNEEDSLLLRQRIEWKLRNKPNYWRYCSKVLSNDEMELFIKNMNESELFYA